MGQVTAKTIEQALAWIDSNGHHECGLHWAKGRSRETGCYELGDETHFYYRGWGDKLLIPLALKREMNGLLKPNTRPFDTRMYALTAKGRRRLRAWLTA